MFLELPKESQQIDRLLTEFSRVYYRVQRETNKKRCSWVDENQVYFVTFSLLMLHTDYFNSNNKNKMDKNDFTRLIHEDTDSHGNKLPLEILSYYYENIISKESPKFDFSGLLIGFQTDEEQPSNSTSTSVSGSDSDSDSVSKSSSQSIQIYSPVEMIRNKILTPYELHQSVVPPIQLSSTTRPPSTSISSYFSTQSSTASSNPSVLQDDIDIYSHIASNTISECNMRAEVAKFCPGNRFHARNVVNDFNHKYDKCFSVLKDVKGGYLRISKSQTSRLMTQAIHIMNESPEEDHYFLKIIQMGEIYEFYTNKKLIFANKNEWKFKFGILTTAGIILVDKKGTDLGEPEVIVDEKSGYSNYILDFKSVSSAIHIPYNGIFAVKRINEFCKNGFVGVTEDDNEAIDFDALTDADQDSVLYLVGPQGKYIWKCRNESERDTWIDSINLMATFDTCFFEFGCLTNTVVCSRKLEIKEKYDKLAYGGQDYKTKKTSRVEEDSNLV